MRVHAPFCAVFAAALVGLATTPADGVEEGFEIFDGSPRIIIVNGYSTSNQWPNVLQSKLDNYFGQRVIEVRKAIESATPIARWIDVATGQPLQPWLDIARPALQDAVATGQPVLFLGQQSLQWVFGSRQAGIRGPDDAERITQGADAMEKYVNLAFADGADLASLATHIYKGGKVGYEPAIEYEKYGLDELMTRGIDDLVRGPDVWTPTMEAFPEAFQTDLVHPNALGAEIMAQQWYLTLLAYDVPEDTIPGDADMNGVVSVGDLGILAANYGTDDGSAAWWRGDFTFDGNVNVGDLGVLAANYETGPGGDNIPEPATLILFAAGGVWLLRRNPKS